MDPGNQFNVHAVPGTNLIGFKTGAKTEYLTPPQARSFGNWLLAIAEVVDPSGVPADVVAEAVKNT
jgi:hypothetical protein